MQFCVFALHERSINLPIGESIVICRLPPKPRHRCDRLPIPIVRLGALSEKKIAAIALENA